MSHREDACLTGRLGVEGCLDSLKLVPGKEGITLASNFPGCPSVCGSTVLCISSSICESTGNNYPPFLAAMGWETKRLVVSQSPLWKQVVCVRGKHMEQWVACPHATGLSGSAETGLRLPSLGYSQGLSDWELRPSMEPIKSKLWGKRT